VDTERTGIGKRHILKGPGLGTSHMAAEAVLGLLEKSGTASDDIDLLICATTTPDLVFPATAALICDMVGIRGTGCFDVQSAYSGFIPALSVAVQFIETGRYRKIVVVGPIRLHRSSITLTAPPASCSATAPAQCWSSRTASSA
jgi:3-oxoacyl-[acyl-carrier-protein] synthase-3